MVLEYLDGLLVEGTEEELADYRPNQSLLFQLTGIGSRGTGSVTIVGSRTPPAELMPSALLNESMHARAPVLGDNCSIGSGGAKEINDWFSFVLAHGRIHQVNKIVLTGQLVCQSDDEIAVVIEFLPQHIELTLAESGCISFKVEQSENPWVWDVSERFTDADSFRLHQERVRDSQWGHVTANIKRSYSVSGL
ncbi:hypothetical protein AAFM46_03960 [Arthrobacter sp. TMP15]|uniref:putative quinol monooxygenase n=1 Tax=Arthrobacter sp. TMP15 TaxID=3140789 RepID=UPI0031BAA8F0